MNVTSHTDPPLYERILAAFPNMQMYFCNLRLEVYVCALSKNKQDKAVNKLMSVNTYFGRRARRAAS